MEDTLLVKARQYAKELGQAEYFLREIKRMLDANEPIEDVKAMADRAVAGMNDPFKQKAKPDLAAEIIK